VLVRAGHVVTEARDGREGFLKAHEQPFQLVITDILMPEKDGIEMILELRREFPDLKVIAICGGGKLGPMNYLHSASLLGANRVFAKPISIDEMIVAVDELVAVPGDDAG
jgi:YesN/AraC family two-component response regulator